MAVAFPTIYRRGTEIHEPIVREFDNTMAHDPAIRSQSEGGYVTSRARFTRIPRKWNIKYDWLTASNKNVIKAFEAARFGGAGEFTWLNPEEGNTYTVRFLGLANYEPHDKTNFTRFMATFVLEEV